MNGRRDNREDTIRWWAWEMWMANGCLPGEDVALWCWLMAERQWERQQAYLAAVIAAENAAR